VFAANSMGIHQLTFVKYLLMAMRLCKRIPENHRLALAYRVMLSPSLSVTFNGLAISLRHFFNNDLAGGVHVQ